MSVIIKWSTTLRTGTPTRGKERHENHYRHDLVIKVNQYDLYDIEIGRVHRRTLDWIPEAQTRDIYTEDLDQAIRDLYDANAV